MTLLEYESPLEKFCRLSEENSDRSQKEEKTVEYQMSDVLNLGNETMHCKIFNEMPTDVQELVTAAMSQLYSVVE